MTEITTTREAVAKAPTPQAALWEIAKALDRIETLVTQVPESEGWGTWGVGEVPYIPTASAVEIEETDDSVTINIRPVSEEKQAQRYTFAEKVLQLPAQDQMQEIEDPCEVYAKGGPLWLYHGCRELVMQFPPHWRQAMVVDLEEEDPAAAYEMARDILKDEGPNSHEITMEYINGSVAE